MPVQLLLALLKSPAETGAVLPSSRFLAGAMAHAASGADLVIELGAGTGPVTTALLQRLPHTPLVAVEIQPSLAHRLKRRHPQVDVRQASAREVVDEHLHAPGRIVLVSSLPFRSLPPNIASETALSLCEFLSRSHERKLIQFTYQPRAPFKATEGLRWRRLTTVWRNTPPAGVWELSAVH
jgi:phospholipid N-methyltransferase